MRSYGLTRRLLCIVAVAVAVYAVACEAMTPTEESPPCTSSNLMGCWSGARVKAHVPVSPLALAGSSFTACYRGKCNRGSILAPQAGGSPRDDSCHFVDAPPRLRHCSVRDEGSGSIVDIRLAEKGVAGDFADGDQLMIRIEQQGAPLLDKEVAVKYRDAFPNGENCPPRCRSTDLDIWP